MCLEYFYGYVVVTLDLIYHNTIIIKLNYGCAHTSCTLFLHTTNLKHNNITEKTLSGKVTINFEKSEN